MELKNTGFSEVIIGAEKELEFSIDADNSLIFEILRDKMYKDKIGSICREVLSNCRDANRESGSTESIKVTIIDASEGDLLDHSSHESIQFEDSGVGISPDRMADIYVKYASSTKRSDNSQTGGFGLGAKTPFAYNDTFTVITVCDYEGKRQKYTYTALIDETRKGKMILFDVEEVDEPTGTKVIVPIKTPNDRGEFEKKSIYYTEMWGCVEYINFKYSHPSEVKIYLETGDFILSDRGECLLIDNIPYPLETGWGFTNLKMEDATVMLKFNTGDLTLSANRESVQYDTETVSKIKEATDNVLKYFEDLLNTIINNQVSYLSACKLWLTMQSNNYRRYDKTYFTPEEKLVIKALGRDSSGFMLSKHKNKTFLYQGRELTDRVFVKHHQFVTVTDKSWYRRKCKVYEYDKYLYFPSLDDTPIYLSTIHDSTRNKTLFEKGYHEFYMLMPREDSEEDDIRGELQMLKDDFGIEPLDFEEVEKFKVERQKVIQSRVPIKPVYDWYMNEVYYSLEDKKLYKYETLTSEFDLEKVCFVVVENVRNVSYSTKNNSKNEFLRDLGYKIYQVNETQYKRKLSKCEGVKTAQQVYEEVYEANHKIWLEQGKKFLIGKTMKQFSPSMAYMVEIIPSKLLPKTIIEAGNLDDYASYDKEYEKVKGELKFNSKGLVSKLKRNFEPYPLLVPFIENGDSEGKQSKIEQYIKQVDSYEQ